MLNIPYPSKCTYRQHEIKLLHAASQAANNSMLDSAKSIAECSNECGVNVDGTWQKRGYSSLNGCVSTISVDSGKILDIEVLSQYCRVCMKTEKTSDSPKMRSVTFFVKITKDQRLIWKLSVLIGFLKSLKQTAVFDIRLITGMGIQRRSIM
ncbi:uncharacterized protein TNCV_2667281 [Trichonephila clavipes]|nr:uncharacterized protein TNCV_2667281 [Trichonephila clavipes]